jgi:RNA polymerase sigma-70 factor (ECF subfamily)
MDHTASECSRRSEHSCVGDLAHTTNAGRETVVSLMQLMPGPVTQSSSDDSYLATAVAEGNRSALETVFQRFGGAVQSMAFRVLRDEVLAEDVAQDVFVSFWKAPGKYDPDRGSLRTFLMTLAHRRAVDTVRSEEARYRREEKVPDDIQPDIEEQVWQSNLSDTVRAALEELPETEREAIVLAYFGGLSYVEVARRLGAPEGTVKSRIRNGMKKLSVTLAGVAT